ncbi:hypothetical protein V8B55DRAFT_1156988 [Mucor lusitanicus]|uniref:Uncharacterized protein n=2 Tax=Mucor circinelloides f. lusitanicus TaxID=29924 RepID=A0A168NGE0_MUCCL|nr:hypothetical protein FB192DRAFT_1388778 [Mucor lusitanicus]OAD06236.1 hypothetical protein MUCCIDRAFT_78708 [Mucor lusitanicus CBS 277.49]
MIPQNSKVVLKDECPFPILFCANRPFSIIIEASQLYSTNTDADPLDLLRTRYPQGISLTDRLIKKINNANKSKSSRRKRKYEPFIEIGFANEAAREKALESPFVIGDKEVQVYKSLDESVSDKVYRIEIYDIDKLNDPTRYYEEVFEHLNKYGTVLELHLHYAASGNWFKGDGCAIWIEGPPSGDKFAFVDHPVLDFYTESYRVSN